MIKRFKHPAEFGIAYAIAFCCLALLAAAPKVQRSHCAFPKPLAYQKELKYVRDTMGSDVGFSSDATRRYHQIEGTTFFVHADLLSPIARPDTRELKVSVQTEELAQISLDCSGIRIRELGAPSDALHPLELIHDPFQTTGEAIREAVRPRYDAPIKTYGNCRFRLPESLDAARDFMVEFSLELEGEVYVIGMELLTYEKAIWPWQPEGI